MSTELRDMIAEVANGNIDPARARVLLEKFHEVHQSSLPVLVAQARLSVLAGDTDRARTLVREIRNRGSFTDEVTSDIEQSIDHPERTTEEIFSGTIPGLEDIGSTPKPADHRERVKYRSTHVSENIARLKEGVEPEPVPKEEKSPENIIPLDPPDEASGETTIVSETLASIYEQQGAYSAALKAYIMLAREQGNYARFAKKIEKLKGKVAEEHKKGSEE